MSSTDQSLSYYNSRVALFDRKAPQIPDGAIALIGDSQIDGAYVRAVSSRAVNLGISGDTWPGLLNRIAKSPATNVLRRADVCVLLVGVNDIGRHDLATMSAMIDLFAKWASGKWVIVRLLPINEKMFSYSGFTNAKIDAVNEYLTSKFQGRSGFVIVDLKKSLSEDGQLSPRKTIDGLHLNASGYADLMAGIKGGVIALNVVP